MKLTEFKKSSHLILGVAFSRHRMRLLMAKQKWCGLEICNQAELEIPLEEIRDPGHRHDLKVLLDNWGLTIDQIPTHTCIIIPEEVTLQIEVDKGFIDKSQGVDANRLFEATLFRPDEVNFDLKPSSSNPKKQILLLAKRDLIAGLMDLFSDIGIRVDQITCGQDILANQMRSRLPLKGEAVFVYVDEEGLICSAYARGKLVKSSSWLCREEEKVFPLLRLACQDVLASLGPQAKPSLFLAGSKARNTLDLLARDTTIPNDSDTQLAVHLLEPAELLPPELNWDFLPLYLAMQKGMRSPKGFNLAIQPDKEPFLKRSPLTKRLAIAVGVLFLVLAGQLLGQSMMINHQATQLLDDIQKRLAQARKNISAEEKKLTELDWLIQADSNQRHLLPTMAEVIRKLPPQAWLEKYQWINGKTVFHVAGLDLKKIKSAYSRTGSMSSDHEPKALKSIKPGVQLWQVSMSLTKSNARQAQAKVHRKTSIKKAKQLDSIRPSAVQK